MGTTADKLNKLIESKAAIKAAIEAKGVADVGDVLSDYPAKIASIPSGTSGKIDGTDLKFGNSTFTEFDPTPYDFSNKTDMSAMFINCASLTNVQFFGTSNVTTMRNLFAGCKKLISFPLFDINNNKDFYGSFSGCSELTNVQLANTNNVTTMMYMCYDCISLTSATVNDVSKVTSMSSIFSNCKALTTLSGFTGLKVNLDLSSASALTVDSVMNVINNAADMSSSAKTLTLHANVFSQLSEEQIQTAAAKGWNIAQK